MFYLHVEHDPPEHPAQDELPPITAALPELSPFTRPLNVEKSFER
ncbi:MAG: hypothetical protein ACOX5M_00350 [Bacillota bacterium]|jgi:hypothetical protein